MWRDWRPEIVDADLARLAEAGIQWLRVFPLWPDFQPIHQLRGQNGAPVEIRMGEESLPSDGPGQAGLSETMMERFALFCQMAERHNLKLVVGLITGWMSGRLFVPPALEGRNPITDATSISWQIKFVDSFVGFMKHYPAISAWDLGNECNCMGDAPSADAAYLWTAAISNAIRRADSSRPIVSGMHSLSAPTNPTGNSWLIDDQAALTDVLTTHPYPYWVRHTNNDPVDNMRTLLHATAESRFYSDIGGKPCIAEEIGTMGPMIAGDTESAAFARVNMLSLWTNDCRAMAWWCSNDQTELAPAPYDWNGVELELGLLRTDGSAKPVLDEIGKFRQFLGSLPFPKLKPPKKDAVCILTENQDDWSVAFSSYVLAKQAKLEIAFSHIRQPLPNAKLYLLPSLKGANCIPRRKWLELLDKVRAGATLYVSLANGIIPRFEEATGMRLKTRGKSTGHHPITLQDGTTLMFAGGDDLIFETVDAHVLGRRKDTGTPAFWRNTLGLGEIYVLIAPIEDQLTHTLGAFGQASSDPFWQIYETVGGRVGLTRVLRVLDPELSVTEHEHDDGGIVCSVINYSKNPKSVPATLAQGCTIVANWRGTVNGREGNVTIEIPPCDGALFGIERGPLSI